jgi:sigma-B regulation protein RsbU (phosphoserine phosphatase)
VDRGREWAVRGRTTGVESAGRVAAVRATRLMETGPEEAFNRLARLASTVLETPMVALTVVDDVASFLKGAPHPEALVGPDGTFESPVKEAACQVVVDTGGEVCAPDVRDDPRLRDLPQIRDFGARSWVGVPIRDPDGNVVGNFCAMDAVVRQWTDRHRETLRTLADIAGGEIALRLALRDSGRLARAAEQHATDAAELSDILQESLLPVRPPQPSGVRIAARFRPGGRGVDVMGDFYDVVPLAGGFGVVIGDVCGNGATAARTTAMARSAVRTAAHSESAPERVLGTVNEVLHVWFDGRVGFLSAAYATFCRPADPAREPWLVSLAGAGHPPAFVRRARGDVEQLTGGGRVLGLAAGTVVETERVELRPGDALVLYTDGITEARGADGDQLDEDGAAAALAATPVGADAGALVAALLDAATGGGAREVSDDAGVVVVQVDPAG